MIPHFLSSSPPPDRPLVVVVFVLAVRTETEEESTLMFNRKLRMDTHVEGCTLPPQAL